MTFGEAAKICPKSNGGGGGGIGCEGEEVMHRLAALLIAFEGESERGGVEERGRSKHVLVLNAPICM